MSKWIRALQRWVGRAFLILPFVVVGGIIAATVLVDEATLDRYTALLGGLGMFGLFLASLRFTIKEWGDRGSSSRFLMGISILLTTAMLIVASLYLFRFYWLGTLARPS